MDGNVIASPPDDVAPRRASRSSVIRTCAGTTKAGLPCGQAAMRGKDLCKDHIRRVEAGDGKGETSKVSIPALRDLVTLDVSTEAGLLAFRQGILAHVGTRTLDASAAKQMHEVAQAIYNDARTRAPQSGGMDALAAQLAKAFTADQPQPAPAPET